MRFHHIAAQVLLFTVPMFGQSGIKSLDGELANKLKLKENQSTQGSIRLYEEFEGKFDKEMNNAYSDLMKELKGPVREAFRRSQKAWLAFLDSQFQAFVSIADSREYGSGQGQIIGMLRMKMVRERAVQLRGYTNGLWGPEGSDAE